MFSYSEYTVLSTVFQCSKCNLSIVLPYFLALNDQNWSKAKSYCVYDSEAYYDTCDLEGKINTFIDQYTSATITFLVTISNVTITGSDASAYGSGTVVITTGSNSVSESASGNCYLQKVDNNWKIDSISTIY